jgi:DNA helicase II / ATP-dependent DNA helicase PcrA
MEQTVWQEEQQHLKNISAMLKVYVAHLENERKRQKGEIVEERTVASSDFNDVSGERAIEFSQMLQTMELREREYIHLSDQLAKAKVLYKNPYFGRITIKNEAGEDETLYIGLSTFRDPKTDDVYIFDWRAPISSLFYENKTGPSSYKIPNGETISVEIEGRRQYKVLYDELLQILDADLYIGDEVLQGLLNDTAKEKMKSIVATIQADQNAVIRSSNRANVIVLGPPGSGKTSVAMQRIAYLLYEYRQHLNARNILLISPSDLFNDYISNVLPELGEENVQHTTFYRIWKGAKVTNAKAETNYENIERLQNATPLERASFHLKNSKQYAEKLTKFVQQLSKRDMDFFNLKIDGEMIFSAKEIRTYFYEKFAGLDLDFRLKKIRTLLLNNIGERKQKEFKRRLKELRAINTYIGTDRELEMEANNTVQKKFGKLEAMIDRLKFVNINKLYIRSLTFENDSEEAKEVAAYTAEQLKNKTLLYEDLAPLLYLENEIKKAKIDPTIKHIVIDEIQDYSHVQLLAIRTIYPKATHTLLGDRNQIVHPEKNDVLAANDLEGFESVQLNKSYRSTKEITDFMSAILTNETTLSLGVTGDKPSIIETDDEVATIASLIEKERDEDDSFVILAKNMESCVRLYEELKQVVPEVQLMTEQNKTYMKGILVMPGYMAKGFEFTTVVLADADAKNYNGKADETLLYTIASRATRKLFMIKGKSTRLPEAITKMNKKLFHALYTDK